MEHLFKMIILLPCFYFFSWIDKDNRESKFFPIFTGFTSPSMLFLALLGQFFQFCFSISS
ncbi:Uncharacterised protein [Streptococcus pneumoniae]|nr:Uncharacterised protein [Streptococcus pneumoniae]